MPAEVMLSSAAALLAYMLALWLVSLRLHDVSVVDPAWGSGFAIVALIASLSGDGDPGRRALAAALVSVWGLRLTVHLLRRKLHEPGEDPRYGDMRAGHGERFGLVSLGTVFVLQGALIWVVSLPVQAIGWRHGDLAALDVAGALAWAVGFAFEAVGDLQLARFKADPANRGRVMNRGLWRYTRHPNYFGDFAMWWGIYALALAAGAWWTAVGPLVMSTLLIRVSGKALLEARMQSRPGYAEYVARTSGFFPRPPRRGSAQARPEGSSK
jgi:steroid 5-alpha reductase family enzyme